MAFSLLVKTVKSTYNILAPRAAIHPRPLKQSKVPDPRRCNCRTALHGAPRAAIRPQPMQRRKLPTLHHRRAQPSLRFMDGGANSMHSPKTLHRSSPPSAITTPQGARPPSSRALQAITIRRSTCCRPNESSACMVNNHRSTAPRRRLVYRILYPLDTVRISGHFGSSHHGESVSACPLHCRQGAVPCSQPTTTTII
jgi:hypothetical protein